MMSRLGRKVLVADLDPQANLTSHFVPEEDLEPMWAASDTTTTIADAVRPIVEGLGDIAPLTPLPVAENVWLLPGDLDLSSFEDHLAQAWPSSIIGRPAAQRTTTAFHRIIATGRSAVEPDITIIDVGPNLGAINRTALLAADHVLIPLGADLFSLQGLRNLGPQLREWRLVWQKNVLPNLTPGIDAPAGSMTPLGYVVMQPSMRLDRPVKAYGRWLERMPSAYVEFVLGPDAAAPTVTPEVATVRNFRSLMPLAHDARKPMFDLRAADGALGSTQRYVQLCHEEFKSLATAVLDRIDQPASTELVSG